MPYGTINADLMVTSDGARLGTGDSSSMKNRIINGDCRIDQRNAGASVTPTVNYFTLDRWALNISQASKVSIQQNAGSVTPPDGFTNYLGATSTSAYSISATDLFLLQQTIEGFNTSDLQWGTANAKTITLSFWVRSSLTGTFGGSLSNSSVTRSYPFTYTISSAGTWEQKTVTIAGDTTGTWLTTNGVGIRVYFSLGSGSTYSGTANTWAGADYRSATGATSVVGTNGATFYITGVQLEKGSNATSFDYRPIGTEYNLCYRYYWRGTVLAVASANTFGGSFPVPMRATPSMTVLSLNNGSGAAYTVLNYTVNNSLSNFVYYQSSGNSGVASAVVETSGAEL